jgi:hypothetical protein
MSEGDLWQRLWQEARDQSSLYRRPSGPQASQDFWDFIAEDYERQMLSKPGVPNAIVDFLVEEQAVNPAVMLRRMPKHLALWEAARTSRPKHPARECRLRL